MTSALENGHRSHLLTCKADSVGVQVGVQEWPPRWPLVHSAGQDGSSFAGRIYFSRFLGSPVAVWGFFFLQAGAAVPDTTLALLPTKA